MLIFLFLLAVNIGYADTKDTNALVFWEPSKQMTLDQLHIDVSNNVSFQTLQARYKIAAVLPLEAIDIFYWDEQIFTLKDSKKITDIIYNIRMAANTDNTLIPFFSIIIDNKLIASGINRLQLLSSAQEKMYDTIGNSSFLPVGMFITKIKYILDLLRRSKQYRSFPFMKENLLKILHVL